MIQHSKCNQLKWTHNSHILIRFFCFATHANSNLIEGEKVQQKIQPDCSARENKNVAINELNEMWNKVELINPCAQTRSAMEELLPELLTCFLPELFLMSKRETWQKPSDGTEEAKRLKCKVDGGWLINGLEKVVESLNRWILCENFCFGWEICVIFVSSVHFTFNTSWKFKLCTKMEKKSNKSFK